MIKIKNSGVHLSAPFSYSSSFLISFSGLGVDGEITKRRSVTRSLTPLPYPLGAATWRARRGGVAVEQCGRPRVAVFSSFFLLFFFGFFFFPFFYFSFFYIFSVF
jgi:hypothetical protein